MWGWFVDGDAVTGNQGVWILVWSWSGHWCAALTEREVAAEGWSLGWTRTRLEAQAMALSTALPGREEFRMGQRCSWLQVVAGAGRQARLPAGGVGRVDVVGSGGDLGLGTGRLCDV